MTQNSIKAVSLEYKFPERGDLIQSSHAGWEERSKQGKERREAEEERINVNSWHCQTWDLGKEIQ